MLSYKKLDVYCLSIEFLAVAWELRTSSPRGHGELADQLYRASLSIPLNIAEGAYAFRSFSSRISGTHNGEKRSPCALSRR